VKHAVLKERRRRSCNRKNAPLKTSKKGFLARTEESQSVGASTKRDWERNSIPAILKAHTNSHTDIHSDRKKPPKKKKILVYLLFNIFEVRERGREPRVRESSLFYSPFPKRDWV
jgi:hypothetical protein